MDALHDIQEERKLLHQPKTAIETSNGVSDEDIIYANISKVGACRTVVVVVVGGRGVTTEA